MDRHFWKQRWENNEIGFHQSEVNPLLIELFKQLLLAKGNRVFVPLCGKTLDIAWLLSKGHCVAGAELSQVAVEQLFIELGIKPNISSLGNIDRYSAKNIDIFVGDIFNLSRQVLGPVDAIYDRAALVALPEEMRQKYTLHLLTISNKAPQLLLSYEYDQSLMAGPPFSISHVEVKQHYADHYRLSFVKEISIPGGLKGKCPATESAWLIT